MRDSGTTRARLRSAALRLFAAEGPEAATTRRIAAAAGVAEGTIYRHFPGKDAIVHDLLREIAERAGHAAAAAAAPTEGPRARLTAAIRALCAEADADPEGFAFLARHGDALEPRLDPAPAASPAEVIRAILADGMAAGFLPARDLELLSAMVRGLLFEAIRARRAGRLAGAMADHAGTLALAAWRVAGEPDKAPEKSLLRTLFGGA